MAAFFAVHARTFLYASPLPVTPRTGSNYAGGFSAGWGAGNDIALMAIPEPQTWLLMFSGIGMLALLRRRR
jgi:hypothetical protein